MEGTQTRRNEYAIKLFKSGEGGLSITIPKNARDIEKLQAGEIVFITFRKTGTTQEPRRQPIVQQRPTMPEPPKPPPGLTAPQEPNKPKFEVGR